MEFFDGWKTLNARFDEGDLTALTQLVGYKLYAIFDERRFPDSLSVSDRELMSRTGIQSTQTIFEARRRLKNAGLIDFESNKGKRTRYWWTIKQSPNTNQTISEQSSNTNQTLAKHLPNSGQTLGASSNIRVCDPYTPNLNPNPYSNNNNNNTRACDTSKVDTTLTSMDVHELWEYETGYQLTGSIAYELEELENRYGQEAFHAALKKAVASNSKGKVTFNYFKAILAGKKGEPPKKGGEKRGKPGELHYDEPDADTVYPWDAPEYASLFGGEQGTSQGDKTAPAQAVRLFGAR